MTEPSIPITMRWWQRGVLIAFGVGLALVLLQVMVRLVPTMLPESASSPVRHYAGQSLEVAYYMTDGDLFSWLPGRIRPPQENVLLGRYTIAWDDDGFRVPALVAEHYPIAVIGDSFTEGANVPVPWPDVLAAELNIPVQNYGYHGYGPHHYAAIAQEYLPGTERQWVLYAHYSGNDFYQAEYSPTRTHTEQSLIDQIPFLMREAWQTIESELIATEDRYDYPLPAVIGGQYYELALLDSFMWWQIAPEGGFEQTRGYALLGDTLKTVAQQAGDSCLAFVFVPPKGILYFPYLGTAQDDLLAIAQRPTIMPDGSTALQPHPYTMDERDAVLASFRDQRNAMAHLASEQGWHFIDLLEPMAERVAQGELLYYRYDSHWNQDGHTAAGQHIAASLRDVVDCP